MSASPMSLQAARQADSESPEPELDCVDFVFRAAPPTPSMSDETFEEELLRDAYLPKDGKP